jgi:hypothetical protein
LKKKPRTSAAGKEVVSTGSLSTPLLDDVSLPFLPDHAFLLLEKHHLLNAFLLRFDYFAARDEGDGRHKFSVYRVPR